MSIQYLQFCPIAKAAEIIGERWTVLIIRELLLGSTRFNELQRGLSHISPTLLTKRLGQLVDYELVVRKNLPEQRRAEYQLTAAGKELAPVVLGLGEWGMRWARGQMTDDELDVELLMTEFNRRLDSSQLPGGRTVIKFHFPKLDSFSLWWIVVNDDGSRELCVNNPGKEVDITISSELRALTEVWAGDISISQARKEGRMQVNGNPVLVRTIKSWLGIGLMARIRPAESSS